MLKLSDIPSFWPSNILKAFIYRALALFIMPDSAKTLCINIFARLKTL